MYICYSTLDIKMGGMESRFKMSRIIFHNSSILAITASRWRSNDSVMFMTRIYGIIIKNLLSTFLKSIMRTQTSCDRVESTPHCHRRHSRSSVHDYSPSIVSFIAATSRADGPFETRISFSPTPLLSSPLLFSVKRWQVIVVIERRKEPSEADASADRRARCSLSTGNQYVSFRRTIEGP